MNYTIKKNRLKHNVGAIFDQNFVRITRYAFFEDTANDIVHIIAQQKLS